MFWSTDSACSLEGTWTHIVPLLACKLDIAAHLQSLGVSPGQQRTRDKNVNEVDLIELDTLLQPKREHINNNMPETNILTTDWACRKRKTCSYPSHR